MVTIIWFIIIFGTIVIVHEFGHFFFAKRSGVLVREFSVGMGPKLLSTHHHHTTYTLRLLPLGGYVRMAGWQDEEVDIKPGTQVTVTTGDAGQVTRINTSDRMTLTGGIPLVVDKIDLVHKLTITGYVNGDEDDARTLRVDHDATIIEADGVEVQIAPEDVQFQSAPLWQRILINFAGPLNNFLLAVVTFFVVALAFGGTPSNSNVIGGVEQHSGAAVAGLRASDRIVKVGQHKVAEFTDIAAAIKHDQNKTVAVTVRRNGATKHLRVHLKQGVLGVYSSRNTGVVNAVKYGVTQPCMITKQIFKALGSLIFGGFSLNKLAGPVGIYTMTSEVSHEGIYTILYFMASLSINLGIMNLLPIPMLDGGKILFNLIELVRGKAVKREHEAMVTLVFAGLLIALMVAVTINDILRIF
ncbi:RIP metalloprotease RseP [Lacticaseibacillus thailandensis]|uniref:RIP metalloprotease RseP n=1 Tax=Lacticaseibacillus thailandensis TaxID=381741 RepID=UPI0009E6B148|nr:RIP metalloprotease RseP [Lacticaseibacillus thailandensis]